MVYKQKRRFKMSETKKILKSFLLVFLVGFLAWLYLGGGREIGIGIPWAILLSLITVGWCYAFFLLFDSGKWYCQLFAVLMTGFFGAIILLGLRWIYRKIGFTFLD